MCATVIFKKFSFIIINLSCEDISLYYKDFSLYYKENFTLYYGRTKFFVIQGISCVRN